MPQQPQQKQAQRRLPPRRLVKPQGLAPVAAGATTQPLRIEWAESGKVSALWGTAIEPTGALARDTAEAMMQVKLEIDGQHSVVSNGQSGDFASVGALTPKSAPYFPIDLDVKAGTTWLVTFRNVGTSFSLIPELVFAFRER